MKCCAIDRSDVKSEVPDARDQQQRHLLVVRRVDQLHRVEQVGERDHADERRRLQHRDRLVAGRRDDHPHRLRKHDAAHRLQPGHAQRVRRVGLPGVDGDDPRAHDLGHVGGLVQGQPEHRGGERGDQRVGVGVDQHRPAEGDAERDRRIQRGDEVPEQQLDEHGGAAEDPDVQPAHAREEPVRRQAHDRQHDAQRHADHHRDRSQLERRHEPAKHAWREQVVADQPPLEARVVGHRPRQGGAGHEDQRRGEPAPRVADRHRANRLGLEVRLGGDPHGAGAMATSRRRR